MVIFLSLMILYTLCLCLCLWGVLGLCTLPRMSPRGSWERSECWEPRPWWVQDRGPPLCMHIPEPGLGHEGADLRSLPHLRGDPRHYVYVDNLGVLSTDRSLVKRALVEITSRFEGCNLRLHPGEVCDDPIDALGCRLSGTSRRASLKPQRLWRVRLAIRHALRQRTLSGRIVEVLIGHCTYCALLNRSLMCIFHTAYKFIRQFYAVKVRLWDSVRAELRAFAALLPLCTAEWGRGWSPLVSASDASLHGYGVCT